MFTLFTRVAPSGAGKRFTVRFRRLPSCSSLVLLLMACHVAWAGGDFTARQAITLGMRQADVCLLSDTLAERGGYAVRRVLLPGAGDCSSQICSWVNAIKPDVRQAIVFYQGDARIGPERQLVLHPSHAEGQLNVKDVLLRLAECRHGSAVLILDLGQFVEQPALRETLQQALDDATAHRRNHPVLAVIAGTTAEGAHDTSAAPLGYWTSRALRGDADLDLDGRVTLAELTTYLPEMLGVNGQIIAVTSRQDMTTTCLVETRPLKLEEMLTDLADRLAYDLHDQGAALVAVPHFHLNAGITAGGGVPGQDYGELMRFAVTKLKQELSARSNFKYRLVDGTWLHGLLNRHAIGPENIESERMQAISAEFQKRLPGGGPITVIVGGFQHLGGTDVTVQCTPWNPANGASHAMVSGHAKLNPSEWAMIGHSAVNREAIQQFSQPQTATPTVAKPVSTSTVGKSDGVSTPRLQRPLPLLDYFNPDDLRLVSEAIARLERRATEKHPLADATFPFQVWLSVNGKTGRPKLSHDHCHVYYDLKKNDRYAINLQNNSQRPVFMRLLVDGLNTLPDLPLIKKDETNALYEVAVPDTQAGLSPAVYVNLTNARAWYCEPGTYLIPGFYTLIDNSTSSLMRDAEHAAFVATDATDSEAWCKGYPKDVGIITAAFYTPLKKPTNMAPQPRLGTRLGKRSQTKVEVYDGKLVPGELLAVIHLRYGIDPDSED